LLDVGGDLKDVGHVEIIGSVGSAWFEILPAIGVGPPCHRRRFIGSMERPASFDLFLARQWGLSSSASIRVRRESLTGERIAMGVEPAVHRNPAPSAGSFWVIVTELVPRCGGATPIRDTFAAWHSRYRTI
jgi:hypothetical protein